MAAVPPGAPPAGFFLSLLTESFAVRALLGSLIAVVLAALVLRTRRVQSPTARRLVVLAPVLAAAAALVATIADAEAYLPQLWVASPGLPTGPVLELLGELRVISNSAGVDVLVLAWALSAALLLTRRLWGVVVIRRILVQARAVPADSDVRRIADHVARSMGIRPVAVRLLVRCPGGALVAGIRRPVIVLDEGLPAQLDAQELEGVIAHELAHVARRDPLVSLIVGTLADLTFFLPPVHLAGRWLHREREESADEWASEHTRRPAALASGILKVFQNAAPPVQTLQACAAVPGAAVLPHRGRRLQLSEGARVVAARVERLVAPPRRRTTLRQTCEVAVAAALIVAASAAALVVPPWIATELGAYSLAIGYVPPPVNAVESPAFATFRALAPSAAGQAALHGYERTLAPRQQSGAERTSTCPCVETQAQWEAGTPASAPAAAPTMSWRRTGAPTWDVDPGPGAVRARPLLTVREAGPQVGFFVVAEEQP